MEPRFAYLQEKVAKLVELLSEDTKERTKKILKENS